ncbi:DinB family protein [Aquisalibacillus elongatus]|uniref:DinB family protein n=1 Tax=Aquisalibacillus elongatus TaxID=485577 RepID=A0A3N5B881_9BACI|nr:DinB family protein [Aquisalibacillus elongatus]RPF53229.1 DinB family protein [Aquisalibacillus elongatus]
MTEKAVLTEEAILQHFKTWRSWVVGLVEKIPEERFDEIPEPFRNNIRWNAGHLVANLDSKLAWVLNEETTLPQVYLDYFDRGTSPEDWTDTPPNKEDILKQLQKQSEELEARVLGKLDQPLPEDFIGMKTVAEALEFFTAHEAMHLTNINTMRKMLKGS